MRDAAGLACGGVGYCPWMCETRRSFFTHIVVYQANT